MHTFFLITKASALIRGSCFVLALLVASATAGPLPHPRLTPGVINPAVTQENIDQTICVAGWTKTIRPPTSYTNKLKTRQIAQYRYRDKNVSNYEEDHLISLQLGGHPRDERNLWPQQYNVACGARVKDVLESKLKRMVCSGEISLAEARPVIGRP